MVDLYYKNHFNKPIAIFPIINMALPMARLIVKLIKPILK